ncbi:hypothetical protein DAERI_020430 [Deinococcus aerius]|uniref:Uncharacterized protein n=1 Tax=Deinococcus aerius TaxID=200253 RepID=A0A2I9CSY3_9DEIO|nr:hypothetical protein DAERI_020430 [Deinococcus aerius]GMA17647.1 hypothetical protein GCM10025871_39780 [Deinococcus metallilatus]
MFARRQAEQVVRGAQDLPALGVDVLRVEFPADPRFVQDEDCMREVSSAPRILLSDGVPVEVLTCQVGTAAQAGACGCRTSRMAGGAGLGDEREGRHGLGAVGGEPGRLVSVDEHWCARSGVSPAPGSREGEAVALLLDAPREPRQVLAGRVPDHQAGEGAQRSFSHSTGPAWSGGLGWVPRGTPPLTFWKERTA